MNSLIKTTKLTKNIILDELTRIIIDHSINIDQEKLKQKINLLFDDCKEMTAEIFIENCKIIRKNELYGRLPANHKFLKPIENEFEASKWNKY